MYTSGPGFPHGDGDCAPPGCDCGTIPCGFYVWNHSSTTVVNNQTFQDWFINDCKPTRLWCFGCDGGTGRGVLLLYFYCLSRCLAQLGNLPRRYRSPGQRSRPWRHRAPPKKIRTELCRRFEFIPLRHFKLHLLWWCGWGARCLNTRCPQRGRAFAASLWLFLG